jgi:CheY-like chemotaxis protein
MTRKRSILLVDDDPGIRESMQAILMLQGYEVDLASSGSKALELCAQNYYDVVLLDILMPGMNGIETLRQIKRRYPGIRAIMITGMDGGAEGEHALAEGAEALFRKPLDVATFLPVLLPQEEGLEDGV